MHSLSTMGKLNEKRESAIRARGTAEGTFNRHCSYAGTVEDGIVLHSAKWRSTAFVSAGSPARHFMTQWLASNSPEAHDTLVESYFAY